MYPLGTNNSRRSYVIFGIRIQIRNNLSRPPVSSTIGGLKEYLRVAPFVGFLRVAYVCRNFIAVERIVKNWIVKADFLVRAG